MRHHRPLELGIVGQILRVFAAVADKRQLRQRRGHIRFAHDGIIRLFRTAIGQRPRRYHIVLNVLSLRAAFFAQVIDVTKCFNPRRSRITERIVVDTRESRHALAIGITRSRSQPDVDIRRPRHVDRVPRRLEHRLEHLRRLKHDIGLFQTAPHSPRIATTMPWVEAYRYGVRRTRNKHRTCRHRRICQQNASSHLHPPCRFSNKLVACPIVIFHIFLFVTIYFSPRSPHRDSL